jgi:hypothetical protein
MNNQGHEFSDDANPIWRKLAIGVVILILLAGIGLLSWHFLHKSSAKPSKSATASQQTAVANSKISTTTKHYDSPNFYLGFDYPADWQVADSGGGTMAVTSPAIALKDTNGQPVTGQIVMTIRASGDKLAEFDKGNATATRDSIKITYAKPTSNQRAQTYVSFLRYASDANASALDGIYITGDFGYKAGQAIPKLDIAKINPIINIAFIKCSDANCSGKGTPLSITDSSWDNADLSGPLQNLLKSLAIT